MKKCFNPDCDHHIPYKNKFCSKSCAAKINNRSHSINIKFRTIFKFACDYYHSIDINDEKIRHYKQILRDNISDRSEYIHFYKKHHLRLSQDRFLELLKNLDIINPLIRKQKINKPKRKNYCYPQPPLGFKPHYKCNHCGDYSNKEGKRLKYCNKCSGLYSRNGKAKYQFTFNVYMYPDLFDLSLINIHGWYSTGNKGKTLNLNGVSRDHKVSVNESIRNSYNPFYIKHPCNCSLMLHKDNNRKNTQSSLTYSELVIIVDSYEKTRKS